MLFDQKLYMKKIFKTENLMGCSIDDFKNFIRHHAILKLKKSDEVIRLTGGEKVALAKSIFIVDGVNTDGVSPKGIVLLNKRTITIPQIEILEIVQ